MWVRMKHVMRVLRRADDRFAAHVERRVHDHRAAGELLELTNEVVVVGIHVAARPSGRGPSSRCASRPGCRSAAGSAGRVPQSVRCSAVMGIWRSFFTGATSSMYGESQSISNQSLHPLPQHARREGPEALAELDLDVHLRLHARAARVAEDAARSECARPEFHPAVEPADDLLVGKELRHRRSSSGPRSIRW